MFLKCFKLFYIKDNSVENSIDFIKTRGSQEPVIAHLVFNVTLHIILKVGISTQISEQKILM